ncbi:unnamed protein product, partial [Allacma fusca]
MPEKPDKKLENMEDVLIAIGGFGRFQVLVLFLLLFMEIPAALMLYVPIFIGSNSSEWTCNGTNVSASSICSCTTEALARNPESSIVAEWNLICGSSWIPHTITSLQMIGMVLGNIYTSQLSDWYGRRYCFMGIILQMAFGSVLSAIAPNPYVYAAARFVCGAGYSGFICILAIYSMEFLTPRWRPVSGCASPSGIGTMLLGLLAYYFRVWRTLVWVTAAPFGAIILIIPFLPESPRWLLHKKRIDECSKVLNHIAKINGKPAIDIEILRIISKTNNSVESAEGVEQSSERFSYLEFWRDKTLRRTTLYLQGIWFVWAFVHFGLGYNIQNVAGSPYLNVVFLGLAEALGPPSSFFFNDKFGRRKTLVGFMTLSAVFLVSIGILQVCYHGRNAAQIVAILCLCGKYGATGAKMPTRLLTGESYPTAIRTMGIGVASITASLGGALAPQMAYLGS